LWAIPLILAATLSVLFGMSSAGVAQSSDPQPRAADDGPPPGGCTPIGVTASGDIVFPMTCRDFIERHKAADRAATAEADKALTTGDASRAPVTTNVDSAPAAVEADKTSAAAEPGKPDENDARPAEAKAPTDEAAQPVTKQAAVAPAEKVNAAAEPATTAAVSKRTRARTNVAGSPGCTRFRTYDAASRSYRDYSGQRRPCP
jgi:septal ring-binding cell division protein DamX